MFDSFLIEEKGEVGEGEANSLSMSGLRVLLVVVVEVVVVVKGS